MIRYNYVNNMVVKIFEKFEKIEFPVKPEILLDTIDLLKNCKMMTYKEFAEINDCSINDVFMLCESKFGCTHYEHKNDRYLVLYNDFVSEYNVGGRIRWTKAHELGHVLLDHLHNVKTPSATKGDTEDVLGSFMHHELEAEANYFAAMFLSPIPLFEPLEINSPADIQRTFGLSLGAAVNRWMAYERCYKQVNVAGFGKQLRYVYEKKQCF